MAGKYLGVVMGDSMVRGAAEEIAEAVQRIHEKYAPRFREELQEDLSLDNVVAHLVTPDTLLQSTYWNHELVREYFAELQVALNKYQQDSSDKPSEETRADAEHLEEMAPPSAPDMDALYAAAFAAVARGLPLNAFPFFGEAEMRSVYSRTELHDELVRKYLLPLLGLLGVYEIKITPGEMDLLHNQVRLLPEGEESLQLWANQTAFHAQLVIRAIPMEHDE